MLKYIVIQFIVFCKISGGQKPEETDGRHQASGRAGSVNREVFVILRNEMTKNLLFVNRES